jgi:uridine kinase
MNQSLSDLKKAINEILMSRKQCTLAIDGPSGSGKSSLGEKLMAEYQATLFHMDDFFLSPDKKTPSRLSTPGGNVDHERFLSEVLSRLKVNGNLTYNRYDCHRQALEKVTCTISPLVIVEGVYSAHDALSSFYDLIVYLDIDEQNQRERIEKRSGKRMLERFVREWIPLENIYFEVHKVKEKADFIIKAI